MVVACAKFPDSSQQAAEVVVSLGVGRGERDRLFEGGGRFAVGAARGERFAKIRKRDR